MRLGISQHARMEQRLVQSPQMIQAMQILQLSSMDLHDRIEQELLENPLLEVAETPPDAALDGAGGESEGGESAPVSEEASIEQGLRDSIRDEIDRYQRDQEEAPSRVRNDSEEGDRKLEAMANTPNRPRSLATALVEELALVDLTDRQRQIAEFIAYSLDERGYLPESLDEVAAACTPDVLDHIPGGSDGVVTEDRPAVEQDSEPGAAAVGGEPDAEERPSPAGASGGPDADGVPETDGVHGHELTAAERFPLARRPVDAEEVAEVLTIMRRATHPGIGAVDLRDCLLLQLEARGIESPLVHDLVEHHLEDVTKNRLPRVAKATGHSIDEIKAALELLRELDPSPGREFGDSMATAIIPDVVVDEIDGEIEVRLGRQRTPDLRVSPAYEELLSRRKGAAAPSVGSSDGGPGEGHDGHTAGTNESPAKRTPEPEETLIVLNADDDETRRWLRKRLETARWFIDALDQRRSTVLRIADAVFEHQRDFLAKGPKALKPLRMQEIADQAGVHISTVSRAVAGKYAQTSRGIFPLKYFFTSGTTDESGAEASQVAIQQRIRELVDSEDGEKPLSDEQLAAALQERHGVRIARRTVTKYRKMLQIPSSSERRRF
ncbi:hypothetical protein [Engelhardtia mirabilis]|uniref:RNA polymerase sigma-54 factor n=1 Tax=Engelhardtia mirabilis TaxID=2528011 RepID=A0A518BKD7_9BACT|nr:RNA polymerase sigma-54 factor [Planctomycetes bacterium Pla133]QDV01768.1 RNA polymerase sigma-54 factor [Planctomycetes bacterium Pla86]